MSWRKSQAVTCHSMSCHVFDRAWSGECDVTGWPSERLRIHKSRFAWRRCDTRALKTDTCIFPSHNTSASKLARLKLNPSQSLKFLVKFQTKLKFLSRSVWHFGISIHWIKIKNKTRSRLSTKYSHLNLKFLLKNSRNFRSRKNHYIIVRYLMYTLLRLTIF